MQLEKNWGAKMIHPPPYQPWNDGQVERAVKTFKSAILEHIRVNGKISWAGKLEKIEEEYNKTRHKAHKFAPFALEYEDYSEHVLRNKKATGRVARAMEHFRKPPIPYPQRLEIAKANLIESARKMMENFNRKASKNINFQPGDVVRVADFRIKGPQTRRGITRKGGFKYKAMVTTCNTRMGTTYCDLKWIEQGPRQMDTPGSISKRIHVSYLKKLILPNRRESQSEVELQAIQQNDPFIIYDSDNNTQGRSNPQQSNNPQQSSNPQQSNNPPGINRRRNNPPGSINPQQSINPSGSINPQQRSLPMEEEFNALVRTFFQLMCRFQIFQFPQQTNQ
jgi:hypothetical protein